MAGIGGARPGAGRKPGKLSRVKRELAEMAKEYAPAALKALCDIALSGESESARVAAANHILDRAYGRPPQSLEHSGPGGGPIEANVPSDSDIAKVLLGLLTPPKKPGS